LSFPLLNRDLLDLTALLIFLNLYPTVERDSDGFDHEASGSINEEGYGMPSLSQCVAIRSIFIKRTIRQFSIFKGFCEGDGWQVLTAAKWTELRALAGR
jgi:hypothetical protein